MNGKSVLEYLRTYCEDLDEGRPVRRSRLLKVLTPVAVPAALGLALGLPACLEEEHATPEDCTNQVDDDGDGDIDCDDDECADSQYCVVLYGFPEVCDNETDDDGDGFTDCCDSDCDGEMACDAMCPDYGGPFPEENCNDCIDNDCDGQVDMNDGDCGVFLYAAVMPEVCNNGGDDDGDGLIDCCDNDCFDDVACGMPACPEYGVQFEEECFDCIDNDCDGTIDDEDMDCAVERYQAPYV